MKYLVGLILLSASNALFAETLNCPCKVVKVLTGDTVYVFDRYKSSRKIWLAGAYAPRLNQPYGEQSRQNLIGLVEGKPITVEYSRRDRYGRIVGKLLHQDRDINLQQIRAGLAWHFTKLEHEQSEADRRWYRNAEAQAKSGKIGLWSSGSAIPPWEFEKESAFW
jgi:endonuclease YncB( thermonuclease family)